MIMPVNQSPKLKKKELSDLPLVELGMECGGSFWDKRVRVVGTFRIKTSSLNNHRLPA
jgi:hypothetical protein